MQNSYFNPFIFEFFTENYILFIKKSNNYIIKGLINIGIINYIFINKKIIYFFINLFKIYIFPLFKIKPISVFDNIEQLFIIYYLNLNIIIRKKLIKFALFFITLLGKYKIIIGFL